MTTQITHIAARQNKQIFFTGMFRPITKGKRPKGVMFVNVVSPELTITVKCFEAMDSVDQDIFLSLLALARTMIVTNKNAHLIGGVDANFDPLPIDAGDVDISEKLRLNVHGLRASEKSVVEVANLPIIRVITSVPGIAKEALNSKVVGGTQYKTIKDSLERLSNTTIKYDLNIDGKKTTGVVSLMSSEINTDGDIVVALNPMTAHSIWSTHANYIRTDLEERALLKTQLTRLLHDYLSGRVNKGQSDRQLALDTIIDCLYGITERESANTRLSRRSRLILAIDDINNSLENWKITTIGKGRKVMISVSR